MTRTHAIGAVISAVAIALLLAFSVNPPRIASASDEASPQLTLEQSLVRIGYTPEVLAAAGATAAQTTSAVAAMAAFEAGSPGAIAEADAEARTAAADVHRLTRIIRAGQAADGDVSLLAQARATLASESDDVDQVIAAARTAVGLALTAQQRATVENILTNQDAYPSMPVHLAACTWTDATWVEARTALSAYCDELSGEGDCDPDTASVVQAVLGRTAVADAQANGESQGAAVQAAWENAVGEWE